MNFLKRKIYLKQKALTEGCSREELNELYSLIAIDGEEEELEELLHAGWENEGLDGKMDGTKNYEVLGRIRSTISRKNRKRALVKRSLQIAASFLLLVTFFFLFKFNSQGVKNEVAVIVKEAGYGEIGKTVLSDGTVVWLNSGSSISYPHVFSDGRRIVNLKGEAFFEVAHDEENPFVVKSGAFSTEVLGTSFNVAAFGESPYAVTVATGKVQLNYKNESILLTKNQQGNYNELHEKFIARNVSSKELSDWRFGILHLNGTLAEALKNIERKYGVTVVFDNTQLRHLEIDATYKNESLPNVLKSIEFSMGVKAKVDADTITISKR